MLNQKLIRTEKKSSFPLWLLVLLLALITMIPGTVTAADRVDKIGTIQLQWEANVQDDAVMNSKAIHTLEATDGSIVVDTITGPDQTEGLAWDNGYLWASVGHFSATYPGMIFNIDTDGNILSSFAAPGESALGPHNSGLAFDGTYLWSVNFLDEKIYKISESGDILGSIPAPSGVSSGITWDGENLWVCEWFTYKIYKINSENGQILASFNAPDFEKSYPFGLAWDGTYLWVSNSKGIYRMDSKTGALLASCNDSALTNGLAYGLTWDGECLWGGSWISDEIIKIDVSSFATPTLPLPTSPASFSYPETISPLISSLPSEARPVGVGTAAAGGDYVSIQINTCRFSGAADIYFGLYMPAIDPDNIYILTSDDRLRPLSEVGLVPWKAGKEGAITESLFGDIPIWDLPAGKYTVYLMVTPAGDPIQYYRWATTFDIP